METFVTITKQAQKQIKKTPFFIQEKFYEWVRTVKIKGLEEIRKTSGFNDEALKGKRLGQRSSRLNRAFRIIYEVHKNGEIEVIVLEVNKHVY